MLKEYDLTKVSCDELLQELKDREEEVSGETVAIVTDILNDVKKNKDEAVIRYTAKFDKVELEDMLVTSEEIEESYKIVDPDFIQYMKEASKNIYKYHEAQKQGGFELELEDGVILGQKVTPIEKVGIYVPGGTAAYPSSVLMNAIPAKVAGCKEIIMVTPPSANGSINPYIATAADIAGVTKIFKAGGAQAIGALSYGTQSIPKVDKICGPGNIFVAVAKKLVFGTVGIDMIAGPSEILVIADENAKAEFIAADLLSQAEHDVLACSILLTTSKKLLQEVQKELRKQTDLLPRKEIIEKSLATYGKAILCDNLEQCFELSNIIAPEHIEVCIDNPLESLDKVVNAGSIFLGNYTAESVGDYFGGTNHVLPTNGTARFYSALSVDSFIKKSSYTYYTKEAIMKNGHKIENIANHEGLQAHANAITVRLKDGR